jgi:hypothetical protein
MILYISHECIDEEWLHTYYLFYMYIRIRKLIIKLHVRQPYGHVVFKLGHLEVLESYGHLGGHVMLLWRSCKLLLFLHAYTLSYARMLNALMEVLEISLMFTSLHLMLFYCGYCIKS